MLAGQSTWWAPWACCGAALVIRPIALMSVGA